jgi:hypothetical protein
MKFSHIFGLSLTSGWVSLSLNRISHKFTIGVLTMLLHGIDRRCLLMTALGFCPLSSHPAAPQVVQTERAEPIDSEPIAAEVDLD